MSNNAPRRMVVAALAGMSLGAGLLAGAGAVSAAPLPNLPDYPNYSNPNVQHFTFGRQLDCTNTHAIGEQQDQLTRQQYDITARDAWARGQLAPRPPSGNFRTDCTYHPNDNTWTYSKQPAPQ